MAKVGINQVWDDTLAFIRTERAVVVPLVLGTLYLAAVIVVGVALIAPPASRTFLAIVAGAWGVVGQLALIDLALGTRRSVGEALQTGIRRLPAALGVYILLGMIAVPLFVPMAMALMRAGYPVEQLPALLADQAQMMKLGEALPPWASLYMIVLGIAALLVFIRLILWKVALVSLGSPIAAIKDSWTRTRGHFWQLFGLSLLASLVVELVTWALETALGATFLLVGGTLARILPTLIVALVGVGFQTIITVFLALYYRRT